jgi:hypothetical protein
MEQTGFTAGNASGSLLEGEEYPKKGDNMT